MSLNRDDIAARIPHAGSMCLLDGVSAWSEAHIRCHASSHRDPANPLRSGGRLGILCGIEYAAQAMAVHGGLDAGASEAPVRGRPKAGYLASVRNVQAHVARLDDVAGDLDIEAQRMSGGDTMVMYAFTVRDAAGRALIEGRAAVVLDAEAVMSGAP